MCEERYRLINEYVAAATFLSRAAIKLRGQHWEELTPARRAYAAARAECAMARTALQRHKINHGCCVGGLKAHVAWGGS